MFDDISCIYHFDIRHVYVRDTLSTTGRSKYPVGGFIGHYEESKTWSCVVKGTKPTQQSGVVKGSKLTQHSGVVKGTKHTQHSGVIKDTKPTQHSGVIKGTTPTQHSYVVKGSKPTQHSYICGHLTHTGKDTNVHISISIWHNVTVLYRYSHNYQLETGKQEGTQTSEYVDGQPNIVLLSDSTLLL